MPLQHIDYHLIINTGFNHSGSYFFNADNSFFKSSIADSFVCLCTNTIQQLPTKTVKCLSKCFRHYSNPLF